MARVGSRPSKIARTSARGVTAAAKGTPASPPPSPPSEIFPIALEVNGTRHHLLIPARRTLVDLLRFDLALTGTKEGCGTGDCGACTVLLDDRPVYSCLTLALEADGRKVRTVESLSCGNSTHPVAEAFLVCDAAQCGFCTPGQVMSVLAFVETGDPSQAALTRALSGNLCRCGAYDGIRRAAERALATHQLDAPAAGARRKRPAQ